MIGPFRKLSPSAQSFSAPVFNCRCYTGYATDSSTENRSVEFGALRTTLSNTLSKRSGSKTQRDSMTRRARSSSTLSSQPSSIPRKTPPSYAANSPVSWSPAAIQRPICSLGCSSCSPPSTHLYQTPNRNSRYLSSHLEVASPESQDAEILSLSAIRHQRDPAHLPGGTSEQQMDRQGYDFADGRRT
jgi:hypothetical protein